MYAEDTLKRIEQIHRIASVGPIYDGLDEEKDLTQLITKLAMFSGRLYATLNAVDAELCEFIRELTIEVEEDRQRQKAWEEKLRKTDE